MLGIIKSGHELEASVEKRYTPSDARTKILLVAACDRFAILGEESFAFVTGLLLIQ